MIIWGFKTVCEERPGAARLLPGNADSWLCPFPNCQGRVRPQALERYCHVYWIPCIPCGGGGNMVVKCNSCHRMADFNQYKNALTEREQRRENGLKDKLTDMILAGQFRVVEAITKEIIKRNPLDLAVMTLLNMALIMSGQVEEADQVAEQVVSHWQRHCKDEWISKGRPKDSDAFTRLLFSNGLDEYKIVAKQYYETSMGQNPACYKILVMPKDSSASHRMFKVLLPDPEMADPCYSLVEMDPHGSGTQIKRVWLQYSNHGNDSPLSSSTSPPDIRKVAADAIDVIVNGTASKIGVPPTLEKLPDAHPNFGVFDHFDAGADQEGSSTLLNAIGTHNWLAVRDFFAALAQQPLPPQDMEDLRSFWMDFCEGAIEKTWSRENQMNLFGTMSPLLDAWREAEPDNMDCRVMRLGLYGAWAWAARGGSWASNVGQDQWEVFGKRLREAGKELAEASRLGVVDTLLHAKAVPIILGTGTRGELCMTMEQNLEALKQTRQPWSFRAHTGALQYYCRKWHGSHEKMFEYARNITSQLPDGHPLWVLIPMCHYEAALLDPPKGYWLRPNVIGEINRAFERAFPMQEMQEGTSHLTTNSLPCHKLMESTCRNYFAYALIMTQQYEKAKSPIRVIGKRPTERPWHGLDRYKYYIAMLGMDTEESIQQVPIASATSIPVVEAHVEMVNSSTDNDENHDSSPLLQVPQAQMVREDAAPQTQLIHAEAEAVPILT